MALIMDEGRGDCNMRKILPPAAPTEKSPQRSVMTK
jgi:hypothetical protein